MHTLENYKFFWDIISFLQAKNVNLDLKTYIWLDDDKNNKWVGIGMSRTVEVPRNRHSTLLWIYKYRTLCLFRYGLNVCILILNRMRGLTLVVGHMIGPDQSSIMSLSGPKSLALEFLQVLFLGTSQTQDMKWGLFGLARQKTWQPPEFNRKCSTTYSSSDIQWLAY